MVSPEWKSVKTCTKCYILKPFSEFHKRGNAYKSHCKKCRKSELPAARVRSRQNYRNNPQKVMMANRKWKEENKQKMQSYKIAWRQRNKSKALAHWAVSNALRSGKLIKYPCEVCGEINSQAHHEDYSKQLEVDWLCDHHHKERHGVLIYA